MLYLLLACTPEPSSDTPTVQPVQPIWVEGICFDPPIPLDYELMQVVACTDTDLGHTLCAPQGWRIYPDLTWEPLTCTGDYWRALVQP